MIRWLATNTHLSLSNLSRFIVISTLALFFFPINTRAESGTLFGYAQDVNETIPDASGFDDRAISEIDLSGAPANAVITSVDVEYWIDHRWVGDLVVWLATEHNGQWQDYVLWDLEGGNAHDIHEKETGITAWNGLPANRKWYLWAADYAEQDEGEIEEWKIWVHFDSRTLIPPVAPYRQDFTPGKPDRLQGWEYYSTNEGRIQAVNGQLRMDDMVDGSAYSLNEAILHLDLSRQSGVILTLDHFSSLDENDSLPSSFKNHANGDGILISADGTNWYLLTNLTSDFQQRSFDLDAAIRSAGISYSSDFRIKFQQYGDSSWPKDGRAFDNISITTQGTLPPSEGPFGTWRGTFNSTSYNTSGTISDWILRKDYTTESKWELQVKANTGLRIHPSGTYSFNPANNYLDFLYTGPATIWVEKQITDLPCILDVNGTVFNDNAWGSYVIKFFPPNLLPFTDTGTWQATSIPNIPYHVSGIEICTGWNYNDPNVPNDTTYDFCLALETDNTISHVEFLTPAGGTFQIPSFTHAQSGNIQTWHYALQAMPLETPSTADLVGHWKMDDNAANTTVLDSSGSGNHGTARRNTSALSTPGKIDSTLTFNGVSDYIDCGNASSLNITGSVSISAWVRFNSLPNYQTIVAKRGAVTDTTSNYAFRTGTVQNINQLEFYYHDGTVWHVYTTSKANLTTGQWYHVVVTYTYGSGAGIKCYVNNNLLGGRWTMGNGNSPVQINTKPVTIGGLTSGERVCGEKLHGAIDDVMIFNRALSEAEIKELYIQPVGGREYWRYEGKFTSSDALKNYGDGTYTITVHYKDGSQSRTTAWFGIPSTSDAIPQPTQKPVLTFPKHNSRTTSPVTFAWEPCKEANATSIALRLEKQDSTGECIDIEAPRDSTGSNPIELSPGIWNAKLFCDRRYDHNNPDGIALEVGKYSESDYRFEVFSSGLVANWKMDDNAATTAVLDSSGSGNHGIAQRNTSVLSTPGKIDSALTFNGVSDYIDCGNANSLNITGSISISAWVRFNSLPDYQTIVAKRGAVTDTASNYAFRIGTLQNINQLEFYYHDGTVWHIYTTSNANLLTGQWYHVIVTYTFGSGAGIKFYLDNNLLSGSWTMGNGNSPVQINTKPVTIGGLTSGERLNGAIDNLTIFNSM